MDIQSHDHFAARSRNARIEACGDDAPRVVYPLQPRVLRAARDQQLARAIVAAAIGYQHLHLPARGRHLRKRAVAKGRDMPFFVAAGCDHADPAL
ncbi:hypothetical protein D3C71_1936690 [compost metagenome]